MAARDEDALVCDMAETYHIFDYRALPLFLAARLACGLRENSRSKMRLAGNRIELRDALLAAILDRVSFLAWAQTRDGQKNRNRPASILDRLMHEPDESETPVVYAGGEEFEKARKQILQRILGEAKANG
nr:MAG TPA: protein of unknown function (DUF5361) [Caudoviricetes sp.]